MTATQTPRPPRRGIYLLPNLFTSAALFSGFYAIIAAFQGQFVAACIAVCVAGILDGLDGRVARMTNTQSDFGVQYDSLADLISFGLAPALLMYSWSLSTLREYGPFWGKLGWSVAFLYAACAALRLARFNTQVGVIDKRYFQGLASPAAAGTLVSFVWTMTELGFDGASVQWFAPVLTILAALLMVSRVRYFSFKSWPMPEKVPFVWILVPILLLVLLAVDPPTVLLVTFSLYMLHGPVLTVLGLRRKRDRRAGGDGEGGAGADLP